MPPHSKAPCGRIWMFLISMNDAAVAGAPDELEVRNWVSPVRQVRFIAGRLKALPFRREAVAHREFHV
jgi:hypothetical protein